MRSVRAGLENIDLFALEPSGELGLYLCREELIRELNAKGISVATARAVFEATFGPVGPSFTLIGKGELLPELSISSDDLLVWGWMPVFSGRARELLLGLGVGADDFVPCTVGPERRHLHLPRECLDVVDFERSKFGFFVPMSATENLPFRIESLVLKDIDSIDQMPSLFRPASRLGQDFSELVATAGFRAAWERAGLSSARFRHLSGTHPVR